MKNRIFILFIFFTITGIVLHSSITPQKRLVLAHNINIDHPVHRGLVDFSEKLSELSGGKIHVQIFPNEQLGTEREVIELLQTGALAFSKVSSSNLENFNPIWSVVNLPYIFRSKDHYFNVLDGEVGDILLNALQDSKLQGLTFYDAGARSFYASKPILHPRDVEGMKIRVMGSQSAIAMMKAIGGLPTPMSYGEVYTGLQQNVIDGAENNVFALTTKKHGEVAKHFSLDEHAMMPDVLVVSQEVWSRLSGEEREWVTLAAQHSKERQRVYWAREVEIEMKKIQQEMGVIVHKPEKEPFIEKVRSLHDELSGKSPRHRELIEKILME